jgi:hypothetical protein
MDGIEITKNLQCEDIFEADKKEVDIHWGYLAIYVMDFLIGRRALIPQRLSAFSLRWRPHPHSIRMKWKFLAATREGCDKATSEGECQCCDDVLDIWPASLGMTSTWNGVSFAIRPGWAEASWINAKTALYRVQRTHLMRGAPSTKKDSII